MVLEFGFASWVARLVQISYLVAGRCPSVVVLRHNMLTLVNFVVAGMVASFADFAGDSFRSSAC